jgi:hypothetical protein
MPMPYDRAGDVAAVLCAIENPVDDRLCRSCTCVDFKDCVNMGRLLLLPGMGIHEIAVQRLGKSECGNRF